ncbi:MAG: adenylyl-sulfate kinase [Verrucomicrobia bacterium]|nr:adenylyl-sulfate kinase [Verrucomicrobiota bacterium]
MKVRLQCYTKLVFSLFVFFFYAHSPLHCAVSITLTEQQFCDLELLQNKGFAPLEGFMNSKDYNRVVSEMRLADGTVWPMPIVLDISAKTKQDLDDKHDTELTLCDMGYTKIVAFQTRNPMHRAHVELTQRSASQVGAHLLLHPVVGRTKPGDVDYFTRVKCYQNLLKYYPEESTTLSLLPIAMRMAGPREALWHAIIRKNYGCTHFIVGRDHAGPGKDRNGVDFYDPYAAQELVKAYAKEVGIEMVPFKEMVYVKEDDNYQPIDTVDPSKTILNISGTQLRKMLRNGEDIPSWFTYPEVMVELKKSFPPRNKQGFTLFFTGLSGAGKSTIANNLVSRLMEMQDRPVTLLDGDIIRKNLSSELGFSKEHRSLNVRRVGFVASEITKNHGAAVCVLIAPYESDRKANKELISSQGNYIEVYISTPLSECETRDPKGLYHLARQGKLKSFTGIDDPYEPPVNPDIEIDTSKHSVGEEVDIIINYLIKEGYLT